MKDDCIDHEFLREIKPGETKISDVYSSELLLGVINTKENTIYVSDKIPNKKEEFRIKEEKGDVWSIDFPKIKGKFRVLPISKLDFDGIIHEGLIFKLRNTVCFQYPKDSCVNFRNTAGTFVYSWRPPKDVSMCARAPGRTCLESVQTNVVTLYPGIGCTGTSYTITKTWFFCVES